MINNTGAMNNTTDKWIIIADINNIKMRCILWRFLNLNLKLNDVKEKFQVKDSLVLQGPYTDHSLQQTPKKNSWLFWLCFLPLHKPVFARLYVKYHKKKFEVRISFTWCNQSNTWNDFPLTVYGILVNSTHPSTLLDQWLIHLNKIAHMLNVHCNVFSSRALRITDRSFLHVFSS